MQFYRCMNIKQMTKSEIKWKWSKVLDQAMEIMFYYGVYKRELTEV